MLVWTAILAMAGVTWLTRISGFWLMRLIPEGGFMRRSLDHLPGALVVAILSPIAFEGGWAPIVCIVAAVAIGRTGAPAMVAVFGSVAAVALIRLVV